MEYLWQGDKIYWSEQSPVLFPIVGGLPDDQYMFDNELYKMRNHGFARDSTFILVDKQADSVVFRLTESETTLEQYPFHFTFDVIYTIIDNILKIAFSVTNTDNKKMYFSLGAHPGFRISLDNRERREDYYILFEKAETAQRRIKANGLLTGETEPVLDQSGIISLSKKWFHKDAIILDHLNSGWAELRNDKSGHAVRVEFNGFPYLGIWSASDSAPYVCIEPWFGVDSTHGDSYDLTKKEGILSLEPGANFFCEYRIVVYD